MSGGGSKYGNLFSTDAYGEDRLRESILEAKPRVRRDRKKTGKRSDPRYRQVTAYIHQGTYELAQYALIG